METFLAILKASGAAFIVTLGVITILWVLISWGLRGDGDSQKQRERIISSTHTEGVVQT